MRLSRILLLCIPLAQFSLTACRTEPARKCATSRLLRDSAGEHDERARIKVQWARIQGGYDSLSSSVEGKRVLDRAAGSLERNEARYLDSVVVEDGRAVSLDGCVDWPQSWSDEGFDRQAMATVLLRRLLPDTGFGAIEYRLDTTLQPMELEVQASPSAAAPEQGLLRVVFQIDSTGIRIRTP